MSAPLQEGGLLDIQARGQRGGQRRMLRQLRVGVNESEGILARLLDEVLVLEDVQELQLGAAAVLGGCASAGIGIGVPILPGVSLGVGVGSGGNVQVGVGAGAGPVGVGVGVNQHGQVSAGAGVGASAPVGGGARVGVGVGVGTGTVIHDPRRSAPAAAPAAPRPAAGEQS